MKENSCMHVIMCSLIESNIDLLDLKLAVG